MTGSLPPPGSASCVLAAMICASKLPHGNWTLRVMVLRRGPSLLNHGVIKWWRHHTREGTHILWENLQRVAFVSHPCYHGRTKYSSLPEDTETSHLGNKVKLSLDAESVGALDFVFLTSKGSLLFIKDPGYNQLLWLQAKSKASSSSHLLKGWQRTPTSPKRLRHTHRTVYHTGVLCFRKGQEMHSVGSCA